MAWNDDSWRDGYDAWKLASPDDEYEDDPCDHEETEIDILDGRARCARCGESWWATDDEVLRQIDHEAAYAEYEARDNRRQWWSDIFYNVRHPLQAIHWQMQKRGWFRQKALTDDDIPF